LEFPLKRIFDHIIVISEALADRFDDRSRVTVLNGGAETDRLVAYDINESRRVLGVPKECFLLGMSNVIAADHRDNDVVFEAMRGLVGRFDNLWLLATGADIKYVHSAGEEYGFRQRLVSPGYVSFGEYNRYLSSCDAFVLPYGDDRINRGRWPNRLGDYLCVCRPIITNPTGDVARLFQSYKIGVLCDFSAEAFSRTIGELIDGTIQAQDYVRDSRHVAEEVLSFEGRVKKILGILECLQKAGCNLSEGGGG